MERKTEAEMASYELHFNFPKKIKLHSYQVVIRKIFLNHYIFLYNNNVHEAIFCFCTIINKITRLL